MEWGVHCYYYNCTVNEGDNLTFTTAEFCSPDCAPTGPVCLMMMISVCQGEGCVVMRWFKQQLLLLAQGGIDGTD